jgi:hypothetical protein
VPKVEIDTPGVTVRMEADEISVDALAVLALKTYRDAGGWPHPTPSAMGFTAERRGVYDLHDSEQYGDGRQIDGN